MRLVRATLKDSYYVHKTLCEYCEEHKEPFDKEAFHVWPGKLSKEENFYYLLMHSKKVAGMIWGRVLKDEPKPTIEFHGKFLRRVLRGQPRFDAELQRVFDDLRKEFEVTRLLVPEGEAILEGHRKIGTLVEVK